MPDTNLDSLKLASALGASQIDANFAKERVGLGTIGTTGVVETTFIARYAGTLTAVLFVAGTALAANDTNFFLVTITNTGAGAGSAAMLAATAANGTQVTGGAALVAYTKRTLTLNATPANLVVAVGDTISVKATVTGTLANAVAAASLLLMITPS